MVRHRNLKLLALVFLLLCFVGTSSETTLWRKILSRFKLGEESFGVQLQTSQRRDVILDNGIVRVTISSPDGSVTAIKYNGIDNLLETQNESDNRGYWDVVWYEPGKHDQIDKLKCKEFKVIKVSKDEIEISFTRKWNMDLNGSQVPLNVDKRFILRRGLAGFYYYAILEREQGWPDVDMDQIRIVFKLQDQIFNYMAISDSKQRIMPVMSDREHGRPLAYPEAVLLTNPKNERLRGEVDDKYQYSLENKDNKVHGWISKTDDTPVGFWMISPSSEYFCGGPIKQDLTSHAGPILLNMFTSTHYAGKEINTEFRNGEPWKKVFGPSLVYLNSAEPGNQAYAALWDDAKAQMRREVECWPYDFVSSLDYPNRQQRGTVFGQFQIHDPDKWLGANGSFVGLAVPGELGSFQLDTKGYQFWTNTDSEGYFSIKNIRPGNYSLYAWAPGFIGDYKYDQIITIAPGSNINLEAIVYEPPRNGPTYWEIGYPDRSAAEFFIPDPYPTLMNQLYTTRVDDKYRQYGLWERYTDLYPRGDLVYNVGTSDYRRDWFFAQVTRERGNKTYEATTWQVEFDLRDWDATGNYTLQLALASKTQCEIQVRFNNPNVNDRPLFSSGLIGKDNAIARHGIHGLYRLYSIDVPGSKLQQGTNILYLTQPRHMTPFQGVMYDYIRFEGPSTN